MKHTLFHASLALTFSVHAMAADAVFSLDGQFVTLANPSSGTEDLWRVNLKTKAIEKITIDLLEDEGVVSLAAGAKGELLLLTDKAVYVQTVKGTKKVCDTTGVEDARNLTMAPTKAGGGMGDCLIVSGIDKDGQKDTPTYAYYSRKPDGKEFEPVLRRRSIEDVGEGGFSRDGRFFFCTETALLGGTLRYFNEGDPNKWHILMEATNIAPLVSCGDTLGHDGEFSVTETIAIAGNKAYVALEGRHESGRLLRVTIPAKLPPNDGNDSNEGLEAHYKMQAKALSSVTVLDYSQGIGSLAATVVKGEERVFFISRNRADSQLMLWTSKTGKTESLWVFRDPEQE